jgi:hypothetical protein
MTKPVFDLILGCKTMKELGIVLDFRTNEITMDQVILPMRDINNLTSPSMDKAWAVNNSMALEPHSTQEVTERVVASSMLNMKRQISNQLFAASVLTLVSKTKTSYWSYSQNLRNILMEH